METKTIKIRYTREGVTPMEKYSNGDWIDLRAGVDMALTKGELALIPLGVAMQLPQGYEALVAPRSSSARKALSMKPIVAIMTNGCYQYYLLKTQ